MIRTRFNRLWLVVAVLAAAAPTPTLHARTEGPVRTLKELMCRSAGCVGGTIDCAEVTGELKSPTGTGSISVKWFCYEGGKAPTPVVFEGEM